MKHYPTGKPTGIRETQNEQDNRELITDLPFNLAGESLNAEHDAQQEANEKRVRALAESEARKAQLELMPTDEIKTALAIDKRQHEIDAEPKRDFTALFNCPDCGWHFTQCECKPNEPAEPKLVRCPDHRNGGATTCPRGGAALQIWQRKQWGD